MYQYKLENTTFKRYNKKYITPPIFNAYKINSWAMLAGILSGLLVYMFVDNYAEFLIADLIMAISFVINAFVLKSIYTSGIANVTVAKDTTSYYVSNFYALFTQVAFWRSFISLPFTMIFYGPEAFLNNNFCWIISICLDVFMTLVMTGRFAKHKFYNRSLQKEFSAVIDGPVECGEDCNELIAKNKVSVQQLHHIENANSEYFECQDDFFNTAREIKEIVGDYEVRWRMEVINANYGYEEELPDHTPLYEKLNDVLEEHAVNAVRLNTVTIELNKKPFIAKEQSVPVKRVEKRNDRIVDDKKHQDRINRPQENDSIWDNNVNWY